jgi:hypothetical protein
MGEAHGKERDASLTNPGHLAKSQQPVAEIDFSDASLEESKAALKQVLAQTKTNGAMPQALRVKGDGLEYVIDFTKTQPYFDEHYAAKSLGDKLRQFKEEGWIGLRLFWVGLRALGADGAKTHLKNTRTERDELMSLKAGIRDQLRAENFELLKKALASDYETSKSSLRQLDMKGLMGLIDAGLEQPINKRIILRPGKSSNSVDSIKNWMDEAARNENYLVVRTADNRFATASREGLGQAWTVDCEGSSKPLNEFLKQDGAAPSEIGVIPFTWRTDVRDRLKGLEEEMVFGIDETSREDYQRIQSWLMGSDEIRELDTMLSNGNGFAALSKETPPT